MIERLLRLVGRWARKPVNHTSWVAVVTPTDRPKSVRNRCLIELFCGVVCVVTLPFWHFCWCGGFCHRTESDLFLFLFLFRVPPQKKTPLHHKFWYWLIHQSKTSKRIFVPTQEVIKNSTGEGLRGSRFLAYLRHTPRASTKCFTTPAHYRKVYHYFFSLISPWHIEEIG